MNHTLAGLFSDHLIAALSRTLIYSLGQGALLSAIIGLMMTFTRSSSAAIRYNLLVAMLALFAVVVAGTFIIELNKGENAVPVSAGHYALKPGPVPSGITGYHAVPSFSVLDTLGSFLNKYAAAIVWIWFLVVCARCVQFIAGLRDVYYLRHKDTFSLGSYWEERVRQLGARIGIKRWIDILESARTKTPMVIGHLKPLILVPVGMLASLSADEAEAILLHELAHIRRADYLVNLLQNLFEIVLFFNPAVLWLSALIKAERENCCDDLALAQSGKVNYLKALVACQEYNQPSPAYAMALKGANGGLKNRVTRIISSKNLPLNKREKSLMAVCLIAAGLFAMAFANGVTAVAFHGDITKQARAKSDSLRTQHIISDMVNDGIIAGPDGLSFKIGTDEFVVNYKKQPDVVYQKYRARYVNDEPHGHDDWVWYYHFNSKKYSSIAAGKPYDSKTDDVTTGVFQGKLN